MFKFSTFIALLILVPHFLFAQNNQYQFSQLDITNGLSSNRVNCIYKDAQGFMWFGTMSGLSRYDGYEFKVFKHNTADAQSLFSNYIEKIYEGPGHKMWVFTNNGVSIYDPNTEKFSNDINVELKRYHISTHSLKSIKKDREGDFWFLTKTEGVFVYNSKTTNTISYSFSDNSKIALHSNSVVEVVSDINGLVWLIYNDGTIDKIDKGKQQLLSRSSTLFKANNGKVSPYAATLDNEHQLWIYISESESGIYRYDPVTDKIDHLVKGVVGKSLNSNIIYDVVQGNGNTIWIGTDHGGINLVDIKTKTFKYLLNRVDDQKSLRGNSVVLFKDNTGIIWAGTTKQGVSYFHKGIIQFPLISNYILDNTSLPYEDVDCFVEDKKGNLWIGTNGGGLLFFNNSTKKYTQFKHNSADPNSLTNDIVISMFIDHEQKLWIGTYFGGMDRLDGNKFTHYRHRDSDPNSLSDDRVYTIIEDSSHELWTGTYTGALNIYDPKTNGFKHPRYKMVSEYTSVIFEDRDNNIWIGRDKGVDVINKRNGQVKHYKYQLKQQNSLVANDVNCVIQDKKGLIWIGTKEGISILNSKTGIFTNLVEQQGLPSNNVWSIVEDNKGRMWVSTANGIASIATTAEGGTYNFEVHKYNGFDGLQGNEFNSNSALKLRNGDIIFGGAHGFNLFNPEKINSFGLKPALLLTDFQLFNKSVTVGDTINGNVLLSRSITDTRSLVLSHNENVFNISFAACDYYNPDKIIYQYKLDGFDKEWLIAPSGSRKATYTNLDAGTYFFKVKATDNNDPGSGSTTTLKITILPPFWKSPLFYVLYALSILSLLFYIRHRGIVKLKKEFKEKQDKSEAERKVIAEKEAARRMHELDLMKIKFFTNVSHEFRTPLSLIISPIDTLIKNSNQPEQQNQLLMIKRNGRRLLNLVNQLLDFRKMESKELKLNLEKGDIVKFVKEVSCSFTDMAGQNQIRYQVSSEVNGLTTRFDHDKIERILFNLLSNAFKFTPSGGQINVSIQVLASNEDENQFLQIKVLDTGIGIPKEKLEKIFDRFYQVSMPEGLLNQGSGIGLSITSEFVKMHSGEIFVESEPGNGSCFTLKLPVKIEDEVIEDGIIVSQSIIETQKPLKNSPELQKRPVVLIIDDNDDLRFYLKDNLKNIFNIIEASNGKEGWQKALSLHPNLIVSDINMPEMNGLELCKKIKGDNRTSHIPIILLTALTEEEDQLIGLTNGANDYISKPFNFEILLSKINGVLLMQETFKKTYQKQKEIQVQHLEIVSEDEKFLKSVFDCIENNITNCNFSVEELSRQMALSRVSLYKRLLSLTGKTPVDCIRTVRLKRAVQLLEKSKLSIANIAYEVGFNNPTYFSKVFKDEYGVVPSEYFLAADNNKTKESV